MFARRNIRRALFIILFLPLLVLGLFIIDQKHDLVLSKFSTASIEKTVHLRSKRSTIDDSDEQLQQENTPTMNVDHHPNQWPPLPSPYSMLYPVIDTKHLERFVHLDLKGAAPKLDYYRKLFPLLKQWGATGLLIEYEDMFPFAGRLAVIRHGLAYTKADIEQLLQLAKVHGLKVMPLLQVYGHLEYVLKLKEFIHLREDKRYPQVITPCLEESYTLIFGKSKNITHA